MKDNQTSVTDTDGQNLHRKLENQLSADLSYAQAQFLEATKIRDGLTEEPSGAFVSLTLGE